MPADGRNIEKHLKSFGVLDALQEETPNAWQLVWKLVDRQGWNCVVFCNRTGLDENHFYKAKRGDSSVPLLPTLMAICAALDLDKLAADEVLAAAGITLSKAIPLHRAYIYTITELAGEPLHIRSEFLERLGFEGFGADKKTGKRAS